MRVCYLSLGSLTVVALGLADQACGLRPSLSFSVGWRTISTAFPNTSDAAGTASASARPYHTRNHAVAARSYGSPATSAPSVWVGATSARPCTSPPSSLSFPSFAAFQVPVRLTSSRCRRHMYRLARWLVPQKHATSLISASAMHVELDISFVGPCSGLRVVGYAYHLFWGFFFSFLVCFFMPLCLRLAIVLLALYSTPLPSDFELGRSFDPAPAVAPSAGLQLLTFFPFPPHLLLSPRRVHYLPSFRTRRINIPAQPWQKLDNYGSPSLFHFAFCVFYDSYPTGSDALDS